MHASHPKRDHRGRFQPGHDIGESHRFRPGQLSPNPKGRPWGVNKWVRVLRGRRYHRRELEDVLIDDHAPANQREAAVRLLLPYVEQDPPRSSLTRVSPSERDALSVISTVDLRVIVVDPRQDRDLRNDAYQVLTDRGSLLVSSRPY